MLLLLAIPIAPVVLAPVLGWLLGLILAHVNKTECTVIGLLSGIVTVGIGVGIPISASHELGPLGIGLPGPDLILVLGVYMFLACILTLLILIAGTLTTVGCLALNRKRAKTIPGAPPQA